MDRDAGYHIVVPSLSLGLPLCISRAIISALIPHLLIFGCVSPSLLKTIFLRLDIESRDSERLILSAQGLLP